MALAAAWSLLQTAETTQIQVSFLLLIERFKLIFNLSSYVPLDIKPFKEQSISVPGPCSVSHKFSNKFPHKYECIVRAVLEWEMQKLKQNKRNKKKKQKK